MSILNDVGTLLTNASVVGGDTGWLLQKSYIGDEQDKVVVVNEGVAKSSDHTSGTMHDYPSVQVIVRGSKMDYETARTKVDAVISALNDATVSGQVYMLLRTAPLPLGLDPLQRPMISINFDIMRER